MKKLGRGRYRIADFEIIRETWTIWRVWWSPEIKRHKTHHGVPGDGFPTLREAKASVMSEITTGRHRP